MNIGDISLGCSFKVLNGSELQMYLHKSVLYFTLHISQQRAKSSALIIIDAVGSINFGGPIASLERRRKERGEKSIRYQIRQSSQSCMHLSVSAVMYEICTSL